MLELIPSKDAWEHPGDRISSAFGDQDIATLRDFDLASWKRFSSRWVSSLLDERYRFATSTPMQATINAALSVTGSVSLCNNGLFINHYYIPRFCCFVFVKGMRSTTYTILHDHIKLNGCAPQKERS